MHLQWFEGLPPQCQGHAPDGHRPHTVEHRAMRCRQRLGHADPAEVEHRDGHKVADKRREQHSVAPDLPHRRPRILQTVARPGAAAPGADTAAAVGAVGNLVHHGQPRAQERQAPHALPPHRLQRVDLVRLEKTLLRHHLERDNHLPPTKYSRPLSKVVRRLRSWPASKTNSLPPPCLPRRHHPQRQFPNDISPVAIANTQTHTAM
mmetsp:Transcript_39623/g.105482  ORF Transcript_39623/g.105482 Transcript_39623/m.105482 type:complete len:206 (+) Transcript_39623:167-784(+)